MRKKKKGRKSIVRGVGTTVYVEKEGSRFKYERRGGSKRTSLRQHSADSIEPCRKPRRRERETRERNRSKREERKKAYPENRRQPGDHRLLTYTEEKDKKRRGGLNRRINVMRQVTEEEKSLTSKGNTYVRNTQSGKGEPQFLVHNTIAALGEERTPVRTGTRHRRSPYAGKATHKDRCVCGGWEILG